VARIAEEAGLEDWKIIRIDSSGGVYVLVGSRTTSV
jgi:hypothetical protein